MNNSPIENYIGIVSKRQYCPLWFGYLKTESVEWNFVNMLQTLTVTKTE